MNVSESNISLFWDLSSEKVLERLRANLVGLTEHEVHERQKQYGLNIIHKRKLNILVILFRQFTSNPLIIILAVATFIAFLLGQHSSSYYIFAIIVVSILLGLWNEYSAEKTVDNLLKKISPSALVVRNNEKTQIPVSQITLGDIILLSQGTIIPADLRFLETTNLEVNESSLTGESKTVFKNSELLAKEPQTIGQYANVGFMGTSVESGSGKGVVVRIGISTEFGKIAESVVFIRPITDFQKGLMDFGNLIIKIVGFMTVAIFVVNALLGHNIIDSLLFSLAIAVGLTPELLPVIVTISLSHGAGKLAKKHAVVKQLISIENLGNMDVLCSDKTGTLTEGKIDVIDYVGSDGKRSERILFLSLLCNSAIFHHKVIGNAIDVALREYALKNKVTVDKGVRKLYETPFDYNRKAMYCIVENEKELLLIAKGAPDSILTFCDSTIDKNKLHEKFSSLNKQGLRIIAVATKKISRKKLYSWNDIKDLTFDGCVTFRDIPKKTVKEALFQLSHLNVQTKIITGDNEIITQNVCNEVGIDTGNILLGNEIENLSDEELRQKVDTVTIFARVNPQQKLRIIQALQKNQHIVGYMGDGINDLPALHSADVGISVNTAVDVAKDAAAIVLLRKSLNVIADGIIEGRKTFNNTIKYILMATSSNFGNMFSAAGGSFFLPFLPMTPAQILLTNGLYDISQTSIPSDNVDPESLLKPKHWNIDFIKKYMIFFGPLSSIFDFITFGILLFVFHARGGLFQTGWFIESIATQILVVFVIRTSRTPFFLSKPSTQLLTTCLILTAVSILIPFTLVAKELGFVTLPTEYFLILILIVISYLILIEIVKNLFLKRFSL